MEPTGTKRRLAAILMADVVGYSRLMGDDEEGTLETLTTYREVFSSSIPKFRGRVVDAKGDALLAEFAAVTDAVNCAVDIQRELAKRNTELTDHRRMDFRIGINLGEVMVQGEEIYGDGVNVAARLESLAEPGGICISRSAYDQLKNKRKLEYEYLGEQQVKNIAEPVRAYKISLIGIGTLADTPASGQAASAAAEPLPKGRTQLSIVVLPFKNMSGDPEQQYFSDGITEDLITDLSKISRLSVISQNTAFTYKARAVSVRQIGEELGVGYVLEGSVRKGGNRVRITAQLIDAATDHHLWSERYDRDLDDVFEVQDQITRNIVSALGVRLLNGEQANVWRRSTPSPEAYFLLLQGRDRWVRFDGRRSLVQAQALWEEARSKDPEFARAIAALAGSTLYRGIWGWGDSLESDFERARELVQQAIRLESTNAWGHSCLALCHLFDRSYEEALATAEMAAAFNPEGTDVSSLLARVQIFCGYTQDAVRRIQRDREVSPDHPAWFLADLGLGHLLLDQPGEAIEALLEAAQKAPRLLITQVLISGAYAAHGQDRDACGAVGVVLRIAPEYSLNEWAGRELPFKEAADLDRITSLLRKAGLPE